jgi:hypothetical protein
VTGLIARRFFRRGRCIDWVPSAALAPDQITSSLASESVAIVGAMEVVIVRSAQALGQTLVRTAVVVAGAQLDT